MLEIDGTEHGSKSSMAMLKGSEGVSLVVQMPRPTPIGIQKVSAVKNLTHDEAMAVRDYLNLLYPIDYTKVEDI